MKIQCVKASFVNRPDRAPAWGSRRRADGWLFREFFDSWWPLLKSRFLSLKRPKRFINGIIAGGYIIAMTSPGRKLPNGFNRCSPVGFVTMGAFIPRYFGARFARWMTSSCVGQSANTNDSGTILYKTGLGCTECKLVNRTCSRIGSRRQRLDDRRPDESRSSRPVLGGPGGEIPLGYSTFT